MLSFSLYRNQISELSLPLCLAELKMMDVSKNEVAMISEDFFSGCVKLETFSASDNKLSMLSDIKMSLMLFISDTWHLVLIN